VIKNLESGRTAEIKAEDAQLIFAATGAEFSKSGVRYWKTKEAYTLENWVDWTRTTGNTCESLARAFAKDASENWRRYSSPLLRRVRASTGSRHYGRTFSNGNGKRKGISGCG
jgi:hypothetical protein